MSMIDESSGTTVRPQPASNPATVLPLVLLVDTSNSMNIIDEPNPPDGLPLRRMDHLLQAVARLFDELRGIGDARRGGEVAMLTFGGGGVRPVDLRPPDARDGPPPAFVRLADAAPPSALTASGATPLAAAVDAAVDLVDERHRQLTRRLRYRPNLYVLTDGENTNPEGYFVPLPEGVIDRVRAREGDRRLLVFGCALPGANVEELKRIAPASTYPCRGIGFRAITRLIVVSSREVGKASDAPAAAIYSSIEESFARW